MTCSTKVLSEKSCECRNAGKNCTGCYCWNKFWEKGWVMLSTTTERGILGHFVHGTELPTVF